MNKEAVELITELAKICNLQKSKCSECALKLNNKCIISTYISFISPAIRQYASKETFCIVLENNERYGITIDHNFNKYSIVDGYLYDEFGRKLGKIAGVVNEF